VVLIADDETVSFSVLEC